MKTNMENKIELLNGTMLQGYTAQKVLKTHIWRGFQLDSTGQYFKIGGKPSAKSQQSNVREQFFYQHAFFFLANADKILTDSRLFLAEVPVQSGLAYSGTSGFESPTLGVYVEWWLNNPISTLEKEGKKYLTWLISGSPLSGCNSCGIVDEEGVSQAHTFDTFKSVWGSFVRINTRYHEAKSKYATFTMEEAYELLNSVETEEHKKTRSYIMDCLYLRSQCRQMSERIETLNCRISELTKENIILKIQLHEHVLEDVYGRYVEYKEQQFRQMEELREHRRQLRRQLRDGSMTNNTEYQRAVRDINKELYKLKYASLPDFAKVVDDLGLSMNDIEDYFKAEGE